MNTTLPPGGTPPEDPNSDGHDAWDEQPWTPAGDQPSPSGTAEPETAEDGPGDWADLVATARAVREENQDLLRRVDDVEEVIDQISQLLADQPAGGSWAWRYLDPYEQVALFTELRDWVDWIVPRYELGMRVLPCWYRHGPAVEELTALYVSWRATYQTTPRNYTDDLTAFHDRWFWPCMERLLRYKVFANCTPLAHRVEPTPPKVTDPTEFAHFTAMMVAPPVIPGADAETVHAAIDRKDAIPLRAKDPTTPVKWDGTWWAILANTPDGLWVPRPPHVCAHYDTLLEQQTAARPQPGGAPTPKGNP